jgi:lipoprotein-anchoring transpeptidase ErfK/SrfK
VDGAALYLAEDDAAVVSQAAKLPFGVTPDQKWIVVHLGDATLVAYEGMKPVFTTLVSPGRGGIPVAGQDPVEASTTPLGVFYVTFKDRATTMSPDKPGEPRTHWIADVPFTQYFAPPFALHAAYWHDRFGEDTSAGCINVSPVDAELLFGWSDPPVPPEWQGATGAGAPENGPTTAIVVRR